MTGRRIAVDACMLLRRPPVSYVWLRGSADLTVDPDARIATEVRAVSTGAVQLRLEGYGAAATSADLRWESAERAAGTQDHCRPRICGGAHSAS